MFADFIEELCEPQPDKIWKLRTGASIGDDGAKALAEAIKINTTITELDFPSLQ